MAIARSETDVVVHVIDEDASVRDALCRLAVSAGYEVHPYADLASFARPRAAVRRECVLLDASELRSAASRERARPWQGAMPVIVLCGGDDDETRRLARVFGARFLLNKPVDAQALFDAIAWVTEACE